MQVDKPSSLNPRDSGTPPGLTAAAPRLLSTLSRVSPALAIELGLWLFFRSPQKMTMRPEQQRILNEGRRKHWRYDGRLIPTWTWGEGPRVLLLHGWGGRAAQLTAFEEPLVEAGFQAVAMDGPAHGEASGRHTSAAHFASTLAALSRDLGGFEAALTHSMGASAVALAMRQGLPLQRAVFVAPPVDLEHFFVLFLHTIGLAHEQHDKALRRASRRYGLPRGQLSLADNLPRHDMPFLVIHDRQDNKASFSEAEALVAALPQRAEMLATQGLGHNRILADPTVVSAALRFLQAGTRNPK